jgi:hypothetical protein
MIKDEFEVAHQIAFHVNTALSILDEVVSHKSVEIDILSDIFYDYVADSDDEREEAVWKAIRQYTA